MFVKKVLTSWQLGKQETFFSGKCDLQKSPHAHAVYLHCPSWQHRREFFGEFRKTGEIGNSNLWFPISSPEPAAASGCRHCLPREILGEFREFRDPEGFIYGPQGRREDARQQVAVGNADSDCQKTPGELERAAALSNFQSCPAACTVGTGRFLRRKIPFSREKIVSLQSSRPKNL